MREKHTKSHKGLKNAVYGANTMITDNVMIVLAILWIIGVILTIWASISERKEKDEESKI